VREARDEFDRSAARAAAGGHQTRGLDREDKMKFRVERDALADAVAWTAKSLPSRPSVPVLAGVMLRVSGGQLIVSGFDYEVSSQVTVDVQPDADGAALVSGRLLAEITKSLPAKPVDAAAVGSHLELVCGSARFTLPTMPVEDYPTLPEMPATAGTVTAAAFATAVSQVAVAAGRDDTLPLLTGVRVELEGSTMTLLATDRYRLAIKELQWQPDVPDASLQALVPAKTLADTAKTLGPLGGEVTVALARGGMGEGMIGFVGGTRRTTSRLLDGEFPKVRNLLPDHHSAQARIQVSSLVEVVRRVALVAEKSTPVRLSFSEDGLIVEAGGTEDARASEAMECGYEGEAMQVAFNPGYLLEGLGALDGPTAVLSLTDPRKPAVLSPAGENGEIIPGYRYLIMPIRIGA
jgi:DNA polymerase-3 subunit beta